jgi:undecaprenyl-diphosphatase
MVWVYAMRDRFSVLLYPQTLTFLLVLTGALVTLSIFVRLKATLEIDRAATAYLQLLDKPFLTRSAHALTFMGNSSTLGVLAVLSLAIGWWEKDLRTAGYVVTPLLALPINMVMKKIISRERPGTDHARVLPGPRWGYSYPSGHSMGSAAFYTFAAAQLYLQGWTTGWTFCLVLLIGMIPIGIGLSRIYLGAHWLSDVVGGWAAGILIAVAVMSLYRP